MRSEVKSILVLTLFSYLMWDYLTLATILFSSLGLILIALRIPVGKTARTAIALLVFASYWLKYGKVIDPEVGLNFLTSVVILKLLEKESLRDSYMIFFGLVLLLSAGALFEKSLTYVFFFTSSFLILLFDLYGVLLIRSRVREILVGFLWVIPLTCVLFFVVPRIVSPLAFRDGATGTGEVGYTPNLRLSEVSELSMNDEPVFQALVDSVLSPGELYWRGNVLVKTDGWNWTGSEANPLPFRPEKAPALDQAGLRQKIRLFLKEPYLFGLDHPSRFFLGGQTIVTDDLRVYSTSGDHHPRYEVLSHRDGIPAEKLPDERHLRVILPKTTRSWIDKEFPSGTLSGLRSDIQKYFQEKGFAYSLSPGRIAGFREFVEEKRVGFCGHYASAVATILRVRGVPTRLVSGFQGGNYNRFAGTYLVTQNDAHVWVEAFENGRWLRLDPTAWIAPERLTLGGEAFLDGVVATGGNPLRKMRFNVRWMNEFSMWVTQWDFRFYQWLEEMDYYGQEAILAKFKLRRKWLYTLIPVLSVFFLLLFMWQTRRREEARALGQDERAWGEFRKKLKSLGLEVNFVSVKALTEKLGSWNHPLRAKAQLLLGELVDSSFSEGNSDWKKLLRRIRKL